MINFKNSKKLTKAQLKQINAGNQYANFGEPTSAEIDACIKRHQRHIINAQNAEPFKEEKRKMVITGIIEDAKKCYDGTNVL